MSQQMKVNADGSIDTNIVSSGMINFEYDYVTITYPNTTTEVYIFKTGGSGGTTTGTITLVYTDSGKSSLSTVTKS